METISHRELRNNSAQVLRAVAGGATYAVTNHGTVVAQLSPPLTAELRCVRPAKRPSAYSDLRRVRVDEPILDALDDLRGER